MNTAIIAGFLVLMNFIVLIVLIVLVRDIISIKLLSTQLHNALGNVINRMQHQDIFLNKLGNAFTQFTGLVENIVDKMNDDDLLGPRQGMLYRTIDGKYSASSLEDLVNKIKKDGTEDNYLSNDEMDNLRKLFEEDDDDEDDDKY